MAKQSQKSIARSIKKCYAIGNSDQFNALERRIAYTVANALRWASEDTEGWERPEQDVITEAEILRDEIRRPK